MPRREGERSNGSKINQCFDQGNSGYFALKMSTFHENKAWRMENYICQHVEKR